MRSTRSTRTGFVTCMVTLALLLIGCSDDTSDAPTGQANATPRVFFGDTEPITAETSLLGAVDGFHTRAITDERRHIHAIWPEVPGLDALNEQLAKATRQRVRGFRKDYPLPTPEQVAVPELNRSWRLLGSDEEAVGVLTDEYLNAGASAAMSWRSHWLDAETGQVQPNSALFSDAGSFRDLLRDTLAGHDGIDTDSLQRELADDPPVVAFTDDGGLLIGFDEYQIAAGDKGRVSITFGAEQTDELLSDFGRAARDASLDPHQPAAAPDDTATSESPTADASPETQTVNCAKAKCIAITYDDGPAGHTAHLLDVYANKHAVATFFSLGQQVATFPDTTARIVDEGHELGVHTWDHKDLTTLAPAEVRSEIARTVRVIEKQTGQRPTLLRPPYGATNDMVRKIAEKQGLSEVLWSVDTLDWKDRDTDTVVRRVLSQSRRNSIVLMHDIHETTVAGAGRIIDGLRKQGFELVTVSQLKS